ncbi:M42 family metallopeptidase, partial [Chloroflexota bacterium]
AKRVLVGGKRRPGVIIAPPVHLTKPKERKQVVRVDQLAIDIGAADQEEARGLTAVGDYATFATRFQVLAKGGLRAAKGKAFDDRVGCAAAATLADDRYGFDLYLSFSTQEEVGLRGARVAAYRIEPDLAFALEGTICDDLPKQEDVSPTTMLGKGPAITVMDRSFIADRRLVQLLIESAEENDIAFQLKQPGVGGCNAGAIHLSKAGVPCAVVSVPCRYIHSPAGLLSLNDYDNMIALMRAALHALPTKWSGMKGL